MHDERRADAAFVFPMLVFTKRCITYVGPRFTVRNVCVLRAGHRIRADAIRPAIARMRRVMIDEHKVVWLRLNRFAQAWRTIPSDALGTAAVVLHVKDDRVVERSFPA